ncbi:L-asparaginase 2 [Paraburkholderia domus]|jgi:L-asparaginase/archaeal Glu-tRNAGln amidotransferase subunit D|uniref:L-asparaginase 2 n=1 Tax=Paraburkholderia domus TaxID=2793075 RepID=A0A9N8QZF6_9BURK|nr:asparaginase [Paraburkholderia domus]MBK5061599.1 asparaginase [Burkholderia sp. R-70199]MBK5088326.1 asparaginase [Burkholderia sp. R-69927]MBK5123772.1 asparaginase [Burkholderia sp. R-69980]MBK5165409.1 asparaginase [Burkholderia sp. R-70211]CAE6784304.1 L-asparaginase 2 [Paraburkholderia domus]
MIRLSSINAGRSPRIAVIGTGGTFAMHARDPFDWIEYSESGVVHPIDTLLDMLGELAPDVELLPVTFRALGSVAIKPNDWVELARLIHRTAQADPSITGFIVTHGTATLEETAWFLQLVHGIDVPVIVTGAQRPANTAGSDVLVNLRAAIAAARDPGSAEHGVLVAMDNWLFCPRDVTKAASFELGAFESPGFGPVARVEADARITWRRGAWPARAAENAAPWFDRAIVESDEAMTMPRVNIVMSYAGADGVAVDALVAAGSAGIVSAGLVPGRPAAGEIAAYRHAVEAGVVVVQSSRAARGVVPPQAFLQRDGIVAGGDLAPVKLRIALMLALSLPDGSASPGERRERIQRILLAL